MTEQDTSIMIQIGGTFDMAVTRQRIRRLSDEFQWSSMLRLRVIAAFTALAETLYFREHQREIPLTVNLCIFKDERRDTIEYHVDVNFEEIRKRFPVAHWRLERVSDDLVIKNSGEIDHLVLRIWSDGGR